MVESYRTLAGSADSQYKDKGSSFYAYVFPARDRTQCEEMLGHVKANHPKARHFCYAFRLGVSGEDYRMQDDGEPSGTAGKPIYGQLAKHDLTHVIGIVVRYFGGVKLGTSGLIQAYKEATARALADAQIVTKSLYQSYQIYMDYERLPILLEALKQANISILNKSFAQKPCLLVAIPLSDQQQMWHSCASQFIGYSADLEQLANDPKIQIIEQEILPL